MNHFFDNFLIILLLSGISYILGSIPTAYIISKIFFKEDIRNVGSGNVGALNFLRVTRSKFLSVIVLLLDVAKGYLALWISSSFLEGILLIFPTIAVLMGHVFPVWLKGKGGRGLATLAGVFLFLKPSLIGIWLIFFLILYGLFKKRYILSGTVSIVLVIFSSFTYLKFHLLFILIIASVFVILQYIPRIKQEMAK